MVAAMTLDTVAQALTDELVAACGARLGGDSTVAPSETPASAGWTLAVAVSGPVRGTIVVWFELTSADAAARVALAADGPPTEQAIAGFLTALVQEAATALRAREGFAAVVTAPPIIGRGPAAAGSRAFYIAVPNTASCLLAVGPQAPVQVDDRLGAVLGVDLPLMVRFGRAVLPFRSIADLGPGSLIDMGRSPDEPVDLVVGDRVIARGEVVVVGGNYGVRITELTAAKDAAAEWEARTR